MSSLFVEKRSNSDYIELA